MRGRFFLHSPAPELSEPKLPEMAFPSLDTSCRMVGRKWVIFDPLKYPIWMGVVGRFGPENNDPLFCFMSENSTDSDSLATLISEVLSDNLKQFWIKS